MSKPCSEIFCNNRVWVETLMPSESGLMKEGEAVEEEEEEEVYGHVGLVHMSSVM